jgi:hypothetical protein
MNLLHPDRRTREAAWRDLLANAPALSRAEFEEHFRHLLHAANDDIRVEVLINLILTQPWRPEPIARDWFFQPFRRHKDIRGKSAVVAICDQHHIRDVQALLTLSRSMSKDHYPDHI